VKRALPHVAWKLTPAARAHVPEPSVDETYEILLGLRERYEAHHKLRYTDEALSAAAKFSSQYISDRFLPDKARGAPHALRPRARPLTAGRALVPCRCGDFCPAMCLAVGAPVPRSFEAAARQVL